MRIVRVNDAHRFLSPKTAKNQFFGDSSTSPAFARFIVVLLLFAGGLYWLQAVAICKMYLSVGKNPNFSFYPEFLLSSILLSKLLGGFEKCVREPTFDF